MKDINEYIVGSLENEKLLLEMAQVGPLDNKLIIYIRSNDAGNIPHFHIVDKQTLGKDFHTCVEIKTNKYFHHTGKEDILNSKQRKNLNDFFKQKHKSAKLNLTNWEYCLILWNDNNSNMNIPEDLEQPDYTEIFDNK